MIVKFEVSLLLGIARPKINVGLIPYLEVPLTDLVRTVAINQMLCEGSDQRVPSIQVLWGRGGGLVPKCVRFRIRSKFLRHETNFDKRTNAVLQYPVIYLIDVTEVVYGRPLCVFVIHADFVVKYGVKADIL